MEVSVSYSLYDTHGDHESFSMVSELLEYDEPSFGDAIKEIDITLYFNHDGPARRSLEESHERFHRNLEGLPKCTFFRKKHRLVLEIEGTFTTGYEIQRNRRPPKPANPEWVYATLQEITSSK